MSVKFQMVLPDTLAQRIRREAKRRRVSASQFIRDSVEKELSHRVTSDSEVPLAWMIGKIPDEESDLSSRVDEILYGDGLPRH